MATTTPDVRRTEGYVYNSLHWAFPMLPFVALTLAFGPAAPWLSLLVLALVTLAALAGLTVLHTALRDDDLLPASGWDRFRTTHRRAATWVWVLGTLAAAVALSLQGWRDLLVTIAVPAFLGGVQVLPLLGRRRVPPLVVGLAGIALAELTLWAASVTDDADLVTRLTATYWVGFAAAAIVGFGAMFRNVLVTTRELERARVDGARLAVAEERLRFSRDLHDVFGRTLSAVALKAELGARQAETGRPEAAATMREVQGIATRALTEVREVVRGYREADLATEVAGARALLQAADIEVGTASEGAPLPGPVARVFGWVVREAATNVLRHSEATRVDITVRTGTHGAALEVVNDRPHPAAADAAGSGLAGLAERLAEVGGELSSGLVEDEFVLTASVDAGALARLADAGREAG